ncbi:transposase [Acinetobacter sp. PW68]|nr:transposase [Acinetobacter sp. PW68]
MNKSLFLLSLPMVIGFVKGLIKFCGLSWTGPDYTTLCRRKKHLDIKISDQNTSNVLC